MANDGASGSRCQRRSTCLSGDATMDYRAAVRLGLRCLLGPEVALRAATVTGGESLVAPSWRSEFWQMQRATPISSGALLGMRNHSFAARKGWVKHSGPIFGHKGVLASCCDEAREEAS